VEFWCSTADSLVRYDAVDINAPLASPSERETETETEKMSLWIVTVFVLLGTKKGSPVFLPPVICFI